MNPIVIYSIVVIIAAAVGMMIKYRDGKTFFATIGVGAMGLFLGYLLNNFYDDYKTKSKYKLEQKSIIKQNSQSMVDTATWGDAETVTPTSIVVVGTKASNSSMSSDINYSEVSADYKVIVQSNSRDQPIIYDTS